MQTPAGEAGACEIDPTTQLFGETVARRIVLNKRTKNKYHWITICRTWRGDRNQQLLDLHRQRLSEHLGNVVSLGDRS